MAVDKLVDSTQLDADLTSVANAIRAKGGTSEQMTFPAEFVRAVQEIPTSGEPSNEAIVNNSKEIIKLTGYARTLAQIFGNYNAKIMYISGYTNLNLSYVFSDMNNLEAVILPDATAISAYSFWSTASSAKKVGIDIYKKNDFPNATPFRWDNGADIILRASEMSTTGFTASTWGVSANLVFYVPSALLTDYRQATNWNTFGDSRILPIEGSRYENTGWWESL